GFISAELEDSGRPVGGGGGDLDRRNAVERAQQRALHADITELARRVVFVETLLKLLIRSHLIERALHPGQTRVARQRKQERTLFADKSVEETDRSDAGPLRRG